MSIMADAPVAVTAATRPPLQKRPIPHEKTPDRPTPANPRPHPRTAGLSGQRDDAARQRLDALFRQYAPMVLATATAARALRPADRDLADDIAQEAWLEAWVLLLRGEELRSPAGFLAMRARRCAVDHYRLACTRHEQATDYTDELAVNRLARLIGAVA